MVSYFPDGISRDFPPGISHTGISQTTLPLGLYYKIPSTVQHCITPSVNLQNAVHVTCPGVLKLFLTGCAAQECFLTAKFGVFSIRALQF